MLKSEAFQREEIKSFRSSLGPTLIRILDNPEEKLEEIQRNPDGKVWLIRSGEKQENIGKVQTDEDAYRMIKVVASTNRRICDYQHPRLAAVLPYYRFRFQAQVPDIVESPSWAIRVPSSQIYTLDEYEVSGIITSTQKAVIKEIEREGINALIGGGTASGKTTFLNALLVESSKFDVRHVIIQDVRELRCEAENKYEMFTDELYGITADFLLEDALRLTPKRLLVGEARSGKVAAVLLRACNTGHTGIRSTVHCNSAIDALYRMEEMLREVGMIGMEAAIARAIKAVIFIEAIPSYPWRRVSEIIRVIGFDGKNYITECL